MAQVVQPCIPCDQSVGDIIVLDMDKRLRRALDHGIAYKGAFTYGQRW